MSSFQYEEDHLPLAGIDDGVLGNLRSNSTAHTTRTTQCVRWYEEEEEERREEEEEEEDASGGGA